MENKAEDGRGSLVRKRSDGNLRVIETLKEAEVLLDGWGSAGPEFQDLSRREF